MKVYELIDHEYGFEFTRIMMGVGTTSLERHARFAEMKGVHNDRHQGP